MILFLLVSCFVFSCVSSILGGSGDASSEGASAIMFSGANHVRVYLLWKYIESEVHGLDTSITVANMKANPSLIKQWADAQDWSELDKRVALYNHKNISLIGEVNEGTTNGLPSFNGTVFDPNVVGEDLYLGYVYRQSR